MQTKKMVVLDRDGVINQDSDEFIKSPDEWIPIPGSLEAIARLKRAGFLVVVATNQSGIARGLYDLDMLQAIHQKMHLLLAEKGASLDGIFYCPHGPDDGCDCRKPKSGLLHQILKQLDVDLQGVWLIGDSLRDLQAGLSCGMQPVLVRTGKGSGTESKGQLPEGAFIFDDLASATNQLLP